MSDKEASPRPTSAALEEPTSVVPQSPPTVPVPPLGVRPPKNKYRAEVNTREVVYRRPLSAQITAGVGGLFFAVLCGGSVYFSLVGFGLVFASAMRGNPFLSLVMGGGSLFFLSAFVSILATTGRREMRVSPMDGTYIYRVCSPVRWAVLTGWAGKNGKDELGIPWQVLEYRGSVSDITGIQRLETTYNNTLYTVLLCWHDPSRPPMRVGFSTNESKARALQAQAAGDLGVPLLPDEIV